ncbi:MAG: hypothetical protein EAZ97_05730 [Bacteroidetes bacterium]|nr:MAG: hypothetical protein EAZ97_05730 [Bacteroidota bacterium]
MLLLAKIKMRFLLTIFLFVLSLLAQAQEQGKLFIKNYNNEEYHAEAQNSAIVRDKRGVMYFGNNKGVLEYDGTNWRLIKVANETQVRSLAVDNHGTVYVGAVSEFGYLTPNNVGKMQYVSLSSKLKSTSREFTDVHKIFIIGEGVYFQTYSSLIRWKEKFNVWQPENESRSASFHACFQVAGKLFVHEWDKGLLRLANESSLAVVRGSEIFTKEDVYAMLAYDKEKILIGTKNKGLVMYDPQAKERFFKFNNEANEYLIKNQISCATKFKLLDQEVFAFGTHRGGLLLLNKQGKILKIFNKNTGLQDENIKSIFFDQQSCLWLALENGISKIEITSPISLFDQSYNLEGAVHCSIRHEGIFYVSTGLGVYYFKDNKFTLVNGLDMVAGDLLSYAAPNKNLLLVATQEGVFQIQGTYATKVSNQVYATNLYSSKVIPNRIFIGLEDGLSSIKYQNGRWIDENQMQGFHHEQISSLCENDNGDLWLGTDHSGVLKVSFKSLENLALDTIVRYDTLQGLPSMNDIYVHKIDTELIFTNNKGVFRLDSAQNKFVPHSIFGKQFNSGKMGISYIKEDRNKNLWLRVNDGEKDWIDIAIKQPDNTYQMDTITLKRLSRSSLSSIYNENNGVSWLGSVDGLYRYDGQFAGKYNQKFHALIRRISSHDAILFEGTFFDKKSSRVKRYVRTLTTTTQSRFLSSVLEYEQNSLTFSFAAASFDNEENNLFSYYLEGYDKNWSAWSEKDRKEYTNLPEGTYYFHLKAKSIYDVESEVSTYHFTILPPWYRTIWAYVLYVVFGGGMVWGIVKFYTNRLEKDKNDLAKVIDARTAEVVLQKEQIEEKNVSLETQKQEISKQRDQIRKSYRNVKLLSTIGQDITSSLVVEDIIEKVYENVNALMDATAFGIGVYRELQQKIEIRGFIEKGEKLPPHTEDMNDNNRLSAWCLRNEQVVMINDYEVDIHKYIEGYKRPEFGEIPSSIIYHPLNSKGKVIGVLTVQSFQKDAYTPYHLDIMNNLATYVAISLENALLYESLEEKVRLRTLELVEQSKVLEKKNSDITASINYASRIQAAILPSLEEMKAHLPEIFVFFKPRDIISGDFYWFAEAEDNKVLIAAVDCTGHGVPGAFMSMIGNDILNEAVNSLGIYEPDKILSQLHKGIRKALKQEESNNRDGMDMALCCIDTKNKIIEYSGAKNPFIYIQNNELHEIKGDKTPVGGSQQKEELTYAKHNILADGATMCYIFSDGFQDQFGGEKGRKFMHRNLSDLFFEIHQKSMEVQRDILDKTLQNWLGEHHKRIDDILIIGFKI